MLAQPDMGDRYFLLPMLSGWTDVFAVPGTRTTGGGASTFLVTGPGWSGTVPEGMTELKSPTSLVWLLGRIYCTGTPEDYAAEARRAVDEGAAMLHIHARKPDGTPSHDVEDFAAIVDAAPRT